MTAGSEAGPSARPEVKPTACEKRFPRSGGFTLIELLVVLAVMATLLAIVAPRYWNSVDKAQEAVLRENLRSLRVAIDQHHADRGHYPESLEQLVSGRYLRSVPTDPIMGQARWTLIAPPPETGTGIFDVRSSAPGTAADGTPFGSL